MEHPVGSVRRAMSLVLALSLAVAGLGSLAYLLILAPGWKGWMVLASGFVGTVGVLWLYEDFGAGANSVSDQQTVHDPAGEPSVDWDVSAETMASIRKSIRPVRTDRSLRRTLAEDFPRDCLNLPVAGGWGYTQPEAIIFLGDQFSSELAARDFVPLEHLIAQKIVYEELIVFQPEKSRFSGIEMALLSHALRGSNDTRRRYDVLQFKIGCWSDRHWEALRQEWEQSDFGKRPGFSREMHNEKRSTSRIEYERTFWFDITEVHGTDD